MKTNTQAAPTLTPYVIESTYDRQATLSALTHIGHGKIDPYISPCLTMQAHDPELYAHLTAWNHVKSEVRDAKSAFPVIGLRFPSVAADTPYMTRSSWLESNIAHLMLLTPRELLKALGFNQQLTRQGHTVDSACGAGNMLEAAVTQYLRVREANRSWWDRTVVSHRSAMRALYQWYHITTPAFVQDILFHGKYPPGSIFDVIARLRTMTPAEAAGHIIKHRIPYPVAIGAVAQAKDPDILLALIEQMSGNELLNSTVMLRKLGVMTNPALRAAYDAAIERAKADKRTSTLKASRAAQAVADQGADTGDNLISRKVMQVQQAKLDQLGGIEGDWLVLGDKSGSMTQAIDIAKHTAALIAQQVKGQVHLIFFDTMPRPYNVTGKTLEQIMAETSGIFADGGTSIGCGLDYLRQRGTAVHGIAIVSDGGDNTSPLFSNAYKPYCQALGVTPTVYLLHVAGNEADYLSAYCRHANIALERYELGRDVDYFSLPNVVQLLRTNRYSLADEIMQTPLLTLRQVFAS